MWIIKNRRSKEPKYEAQTLQTVFGERFENKAVSNA